MMRFFLLDKIIEYEPGEYATGIKCVTLSDPVLHDHFPENPIMPGSLITEGLAQLAGFLIEQTQTRPRSILPRTIEVDDMDDTDDELRPNQHGQSNGVFPKRAVLAQIDKMKFYQPSVPGDQLIYITRLLSLHVDAAQVSCEVTCDDQTRCKGRLSFALMAIDSNAIRAQRRRLYQIWTKDLIHRDEFV